MLLALCAGFVRVKGFTLPVWLSERRSGFVLWRGDGSRKEIALTFDDGPDPVFTPQVLALLRRHRAHATFFLIGKFVRKNPEIVRRTLSEGHAVGNHTETHPHLERFLAPEVRSEMERCDEALASEARIRTWLFRPPRGEWNPTIFDVARSRGDRLILWTYAVEHRDAPTADSMAKRALDLAQPGAIVLMHDGGHRDKTVQALAQILDGLERRGYRFVTVPELLGIRGQEPIDSKGEAHAPQRGSL